MARRFLRGLTFSNVCSFLALTIALGTGTAYAANTVGSDDIINESIQSVDLKNGEVKTVDIGADQITSARIKPGGVINSDLGADAVNSSKVLIDSLTSADLAIDSVGASELAANSVGSGELATDSVGATEISDDSIDSGEIVNDSLTTADIAGADVNPGVISLGAGAVANGRCRQFSIGVGGAKAGEGVILSTKAPLQDGVLIYAQQVPSDGNVTIDVCNLSGTTQAAITDFPIRIITFG
jgi:hypothetical protein